MIILNSLKFAADQNSLHSTEEECFNDTIEFNGFSGLWTIDEKTMDTGISVSGSEPD